jgi:hypothetical protein
MRRIKFIQVIIPNTYSSFSIKNNDVDGNHWLLLTIPNIDSLIFGGSNVSVDLIDPNGNLFGCFYLNLSSTTTTATYYEGSNRFFISTKGLFIPYNFSLKFNGIPQNLSNFPLNFIVMAFDTLEELFDYLYGNAK